MSSKAFFERLFLILILWIAATSCIPEQEELTFDPGISLRFSADTILFDTIFTQTSSITRRLRVYNDADRSVRIDQIRLAGDTNSPYDIAVNGQFDDSFENVTLLGNDSLLVLVEVTIDPRDENLPFLVSDSLVFLTNGNQQSINLVTYGQDAIFLDGEVLACDEVWTRDKPYVIYNSLLIDTLCSLTIEAGTRIYSHVNSYIFIRGTLTVNGTVDEPVIFRNDRLEESFENAPGQWGGIVFLPGSRDNHLEQVRVRNARTGIYLGTPDEDDIPDLVLGNSVIENMGGAEAIPVGNFSVLPGFGFLALTSDAYVYNTLITNCEVNTVGNYAGGNYEYVHCTLAAYSFDFFRQSSSVVFSNNVILADESVLAAPLAVSVVNSIIWGSLPDELLFSEDSSAPFDLTISNSLIRSRQYQEDPVLSGNLVNENPLFADPSAFNFRLEGLSPAIDFGLDAGIFSDLQGEVRDANPDAGAYEFRE